MLLWSPADLDDFCELIETIITNIVEHPNEQKFKELKLNKGPIQKRIVSRPGGLEFMYAVGFETISQDDIKLLRFNGTIVITTFLRPGFTYISDAFILELEASLNWLKYYLYNMLCIIPSPYFGFVEIPFHRAN